jgi:predicted site-specific integrase-resolvase
MQKLTLAAWARLVGVSRATAIQWANAKRIKVTRPTIGVILVDENEPRPKPMKPWEASKEKISPY